MFKMIASLLSVGLFFVLVSGGTHKLCGQASKFLGAAAIQTSGVSY